MISCLEMSGESLPDGYSMFSMGCPFYNPKEEAISAASLLVEQWWSVGGISDTHWMFPREDTDRFREVLWWLSGGAGVCLCGLASAQLRMESLVCAEGRSLRQ